MHRRLIIALVVPVLGGCASQPLYSAEPTRACLRARGFHVETVDARPDGGALNLEIDADGTQGLDVGLGFAGSESKAQGYARYEASERAYAGRRRNVVFSSERLDEHQLEPVLDCLKPA